AEAIKEFFLNYDECLSNDFVYSEGGKKLLLSHSDIHDWNITFANTGIDSNIGQRLKAVKKYLEGEEVFLANYTDGLTDLRLPSMIEQIDKHKAIATFLSARPNLSFHVVTAGSNGMVDGIREMTKANIRINSGYFVLRKEIFDYIREGEELVQEPFQRLIQEKKLAAYEYDGFFHAMDTFKDRQVLEDLLASGHAPWEVWNSPAEKKEELPRRDTKERTQKPRGRARLRDGRA
ncbi:MAG: hypothetical protein WB995_08680, partial [Candidatus Acidiferrales bacterium]